MRGVNFSRPSRGAAAKASKGLWIGRRVDAQFNQLARGTLSVNPSRSDHGRIVHVRNALKRHGIRLVSAQVLCGLRKVGLKTHVDGLAVCGDELVVVELKTTQHSPGKHEELYDSPCTRQPELTNRLANTERSHHMLQAAFGALCVKKMTGFKAVRAVVVVSYNCSAKIIPVPRRFMSASWFAGHAAPAVCRPIRTRRTHFDAWPHDDDRVRAATAEFGYVGAATHVPGSSFVVMGTQGSIAVAGCVTTQWAKISKKKREWCRATLRKVRESKCQNVSTGGALVFVLAPNGTKWRLNQL